MECYASECTMLDVEQGHEEKQRRSWRLNDWDMVTRLSSGSMAGSAPGSQARLSSGSAVLSQAPPSNSSRPVPCKYPMWVMRVHKVLAMELLRPHQELLSAGKLVEYDASLKAIFVSHQWTSFEKPDHTGLQLLTLQRVLMRMRSGRMPDVTASFMAQKGLGATMTIKSKAWDALLRDAAVWLDYMSVPQPTCKVRANGLGEDVSSELRDAVSSIPAYVEHATLFLVICPVVPHKELQQDGVVCSWVSWHKRAWCRLEALALAMQTKCAIPALVCTGPLSVPTMLDPEKTVQPPGLGELSCCRLGHRSVDRDGKIHQMPCDKVAIQTVISSMLARRIEHHQRHGDLDEVRLWMVCSGYLLQPLTDSAKDASPPLEEFLRQTGFDGVRNAEGDRESVEPVMCAACTGHAQLVQALLDARADADCRYRGSRVLPHFGLQPGVSPLHFAAWSANVDVVRVLIEGNADPNALTKSGGAPLTYYSLMGWAEGVRGIGEACRQAKVELKVNFGIPMNNASVLHLAAYSGTPPVVRELLALGADRLHVNDHGSYILANACENLEMDVDTVKLLWQEGDGLDINVKNRPRNCKWWAIDTVFELIDRNRLTGSSLVREMANTRGSTPLHLAAQVGHLDLVRWLLDSGAAAALAMRNSRGRTPVDVARVFGPFPLVEAELERARREEAAQKAQAGHGACAAPRPRDLARCCRRCRRRPRQPRSLEAPYPMYLLHLSDVLALERWPSHADLLSGGRLVDLQAANAASGSGGAAAPSVIYVSHEWTAPGEPDHSGLQLFTLQCMLRALADGHFAKVSTTFGEATVGVGAQYLADGPKWQEALIWVDALCTPQTHMRGAEGGAAARESIRSYVGSIPAYIEQSHLYMVICPGVRTPDGRVCNFESWQSHGINNFEANLVALQCQRTIPAIVCEGPHALPYLLPRYAVLPPGLGQFDGGPAEHEAVGSSMRSAIERRAEHHLSRGELDEFRLWTACAPWLLEGFLPAGDDGMGASELVVPVLERGEAERDTHELADFLERMRFGKTGALSAGGCGLSPLTCAVCLGSTRLVRALLDAKADASAGYEGKATLPFLQLFPGATPLHFAVALCRAEAISLLVHRGADPHATCRITGMTPLMLGAAGGAAPGIRALAEACREAGVPLEVDQGLAFNNASALGIAAFAGTPAAVRALLDIGADRLHRNDHGSSVLTNACENLRMDAATLDFLWQDGAGCDLNQRQQPLTWKWLALDYAAELADKAALSCSYFSRCIADTRGSTPLHSAARVGHVVAIRWLLENGASPSIWVRNARGRTPLDSAQYFGPFLEAEADLQDAELCLRGPSSLN